MSFFFRYLLNFSENFKIKSLLRLCLVKLLFVFLLPYIIALFSRKKNNTQNKLTKLSMKQRRQYSQSCKRER
jgi:hypothetical protein